MLGLSDGILQRSFTFKHFTRYEPGNQDNDAATGDALLDVKCLFANALELLVSHFITRVATNTRYRQQ